MKHTTTWHPDTCKCVLHYEWDDEQPDTEREHIPVTEVTASDGTVLKQVICAEHAGVDTPQEPTGHFEKVLDENQQKNRVIGQLLESDDLAAGVVQETGDMARAFKPGREPEWSYDPDRTLRVKLNGLTKQKKDALKDEISPIFEGVIIE